MDKNTDDFWTDELVKEFINFSRRKMHISDIDIIGMDIEKFKQLNSKKEEPQWEILEFKNLRSGIVYIKKDNGKFNSGNGLDWDLEKFDIKDHEIINSVKRFPDNTVWSVDMVTEHGIITAFKIVGSTMVAEIKNNIFPYDYPLYLSELKAPKEEQVVKLYTESELLQACRDAFDESRIMFRIVSALPTGPQFKHLTFEDYINSLK